eukprot:258070-Pyramimonas_sp.AAC.1
MPPHLVFGAVKDGVPDGHHAADGHRLLTAVVLLARHHHLRQHRVQRELRHPDGAIHTLRGSIHRCREGCFASI